MSALDALTTSTRFLLVTLVAFGTTLSVRVSLSVVILIKLDNLLDIHINIISAHMAECFLGAFEHGRVEFDGELDLEENEKISVFVRLFVERETLILYGLDLIGFDDLTGGVLDTELRAIEMGDDEVDASEGLIE